MEYDGSSSLSFSRRSAQVSSLLCAGLLTSHPHVQWHLLYRVGSLCEAARATNSRFFPGSKSPATRRRHKVSTITLTPTRPRRHQPCQLRCRDQSGKCCRFAGFLAVFRPRCLEAVLIQFDCRAYSCGPVRPNSRPRPIRVFTIQTSNDRSPPRG
jgi:hypothetical protein